MRIITYLNTAAIAYGALFGRYGDESFANQNVATCTAFQYN